MKISPESALKSTFKGLEGLSGSVSAFKLHHGKVRDYFFSANKIIMVTSDRLSAFDRVLTTIPFKGELLTKLSTFWLKKTSDLVPNFFQANPHPNVVVGTQCQIFPLEIIVRDYITGSAWRSYTKGEPVSGIRFPSGLQKNQKLPARVITPSTKEQMGLHDEPISREEILKRQLVTEEQYQTMEKMALTLFEFAAQHVKKNNLILVDTKYEFGVDSGGNILVADEIHTLDSSRFWYADTYAQRFQDGLEPVMLDKENIRQWLLDHGFSGEGQPPVIPDVERIALSEKYIIAYELITGEPFVSDQQGAILPDLERVLEAVGAIPS